MHIEKKTLRNIFLGVISCIVLYWILHDTRRVLNIFNFVKGVFAPFVIGSGLAFIINVPMRAIEGLLKEIKKPLLRRVVAMLLTFVGFLLVLAIVFWLLIPQMVATIQSLLPKLYTFIGNIGNWVMGFIEKNPQLMAWVYDNTDFETFNWTALAQKAITMIGSSVTTIVGGTVTAIGSLAGGLVNGVIAVVFSIYCLFQKENLARQGRKLLYAFLPEKVADGTVRVFRLTNVTFSNFLSGQCIEVCILGGLFAIAMAIFQMPYIPLVSVLVAVTAFIPVVGAWVGCVLGTFFILVANPIQALWFVIMFVVLQQIENNMIYPRVVGTSIGLSGMWVLVAVAIGGELMGVAGMFLMIPVASVVFTLLSEGTNKLLENKGVLPEKLLPQPSEFESKLKMKVKKKIAEKKASKK